MLLSLLKESFAKCLLKEVVHTFFPLNSLQNNTSPNPDEYSYSVLEIHAYKHHQTQKGQNSDVMFVHRYALLK